MSAPKAVYSVLSSSTNVTALTGNRIQPAHLPNAPTLPALTFQQVSGTRNPSSGGHNNPVRARVQVDSWASTYAGAQELADAVRGALDRFSGTANGVVVLHVFIDTELDAFEERAATAEQPAIWRRIQDYTIHYRE